MINSVPKNHHINALKACKEQAKYADKLAAQYFPRFEERDIVLEGDVTFELTFFENYHLKPFAQLKVSATANMPCQRCFQPVQVHLEQESELVLLVSDQQDEQNFAPDHEPVYLLEGEYMDVAQVVEDELFLALPFAAKHQPEHCYLDLAPYQEHSEDDDGADEVDEGEAANPFAILAELKKKS